jgi:hypothetical protein
MRVRLPGARHVRRAPVYTLAILLLACGDAAPESEAGPLPSAAQVDRDNAPPEILDVSLEPASPAPGASVRARVEVDDPDGDPVKMTYDWTLDGEPVGSGLAKLVLTSGSRDQRLEVTVVASDGRADSDPARAWAHLGNRPPRVERLLVGPGLEITAGDEVAVEAVADDEDGDALTLRHVWKVNGVRWPHEGAVFATGSLAKGDEIVVEVRAHDGTDLSEPLATSPIRVVNRPPRVVSQPGASAPAGGFHYVVKAEDPDGDAPLEFALEQAPRGMRIDSRSGEIRWQPDAGQAGEHRVEVLVDDGNGGRVLHVFDVRVGGESVARVSGVSDGS